VWQGVSKKTTRRRRGREKEHTTSRCGEEKTPLTAMPKRATLAFDRGEISRRDGGRTG